MAGPTPARPQVRAIVGATIGNALEFYDFIAYAFFAIQIGHAFFPAHTAYGSLMLSLATFGAGFATRPIGAIVIGAFSDRAGRRAAMMLSFTLMGVASAAMAVIPPYAKIGIAAPILVVLARLTMGFSLGGEVGPTTAYLMESASAGRRGIVVSCQTCTQALAAASTAGAGFILSRLMSPAAFDGYGWRIVFLLGSVSVPFGLWVRRGLPETLHAGEEKFTPHPKAATRLGIAWEHRRILAIGVMALACGTISTYGAVYMTTFAQDTLQMAAGPALAAGVVGSLGMGVGSFVGAWLSDRVGRRPVMVWFNLAALVLTYPLFSWIVSTRNGLTLCAGIAIWHAVGSAPTGALMVALTESLPKRVRGACVATVYAVAVAVFGGTCQFVIRWLIQVSGDPLAPVWYFLAAKVAGQAAFMLMRESAPVRLGRLALGAIID